MKIYVLQIKILHPPKFFLTFLQFVGYYNCIEDKAAQLAYMMLASNDIMHFSLAFVILKSIFGECNQT